MNTIKYVEGAVCRKYCGYSTIGWKGNFICPRCGSEVDPMHKIKLIWHPNPKPFQWWNPSTWNKGQWIKE